METNEGISSNNKPESSKNVSPRAFEIAPYQWLLYISNSSPFQMEMIIKIILVLPLSSLYIVDLDEKEFCFLKKSPKHNQEEL